MSAPEFVNTEIPRDRYGRPMIQQPGNTKRVAYRRTTTFVSCLEDTYNLQNWKMRRVAYGMGQRKDLVLAAAASDPDDKRKLNEIAENALEAAESSAAATTGTALHALTERIDRGQALGVIPAEYEADIAAYQAATQNIEWLGIESFRVYDRWQVAGTADRIGKDQHGRIRIYDIKTGSIDYPHKMAMQLAMYARSLPYDIATDKRGNPEDALDLNRGVIIHLPAGQGRCDLHEIDIASGWGACLIAHQVWRWRATKDLVTPIGELSEKPNPVKVGSEFMELAAMNAAQYAGTLEELRAAWDYAKKQNVLTKDFRAFCTERSRTADAAGNLTVIIYA
jgi:hypothetical protein